VIDPRRAGGGLITGFVDDLDARLSEIAAREPGFASSGTPASPTTAT
jgi:hypothetical protein